LGSRWRRLRKSANERETQSDSVTLSEFGANDEADAGEQEIKITPKLLHGTNVIPAATECVLLLRPSSSSF
jgi:hypothetical protein